MVGAGRPIIPAPAWQCLERKLNGGTAQAIQLPRLKSSRDGPPQKRFRPAGAVGGLEHTSPERRMPAANHALWADIGFGLPPRYLKRNDSHRPIIHRIHQSPEGGDPSGLQGAPEPRYLPGRVKTKAAEVPGRRPQTASQTGARGNLDRPAAFKTRPTDSGCSARGQKARGPIPPAVNSTESLNRGGGILQEQWDRSPRGQFY